MPRKGNKKVRTGCLTCKVRKVKCDEAKPSCARCTSTGRTCDGYPAVVGKKPVSLVKICSLNTTGYGENERRGLEFFQNVVGPSISGLFDDQFWTSLVLQVSHQQPAVRHAMIAISTLYETGTHNSSSVRHYNKAIQCTMLSADETLAILMAVLFTCLEFLQANAAAALNHCRHAVLLFNASRNLPSSVRQILLPILTRVSTVPFFFGGDVTTFPKLEALSTQMLKSFTSVIDANSALQAIVAQVTRFVRSADAYRLGARRKARIPLGLLAEQHRLQNCMDSWHRNYLKFRSMCKSSQKHVRQFILVDVTYLVTRTWTDTTLERTEVAYDRHVDRFSKIVSLASQLKEADQVMSPALPRPRFSFDSGFLPRLYFVVLKCRSIDLRLKALSCLKALAIEQEGLWKASTMSGVAQRIVEIEHDIDINDPSSTWAPGLPPEENRVRECVLIPTGGLEGEDGASRGFNYRLTCIMWKHPDEIYTRDEWMLMPDDRDRNPEAANSYSRIISGFPGLIDEMIGSLEIST